MLLLKSYIFQSIAYLIAVLKLVECNAIIPIGDPETDRCNGNEYYNPVTKNCVQLQGGGRPFHLDQDKICTNKSTKVKPYPDSDRLYYVCENDFVVLGVCPDELRFNEETLKCEKLEKMPCDLRRMPKCSKVGRFAVETNCSCFYTCDKGIDEKLILKLHQCPGRSLYSPKINQCSYSCNALPTEVKNEYNIEPNERDAFPPCSKPGQYRTPTDCAKYYTCSAKSNGRFYQTRYKCPDAFLYDIKTNDCRPRDEVKCEMMSAVEILNLFEYYNGNRRPCDLNCTDKESLEKCLKNTTTTTATTKNDISITTSLPEIETSTLTTNNGVSEAATSTASSIFLDSTQTTESDYTDDDANGMELLEAAHSLRPSHKLSSTQSTPLSTEGEITIIPTEIGVTTLTTLAAEVTTIEPTTLKHDDTTYSEPILGGEHMETESIASTETTTWPPSTTQEDTVMSSKTTITNKHTNEISTDSSSSIEPIDVSTASPMNDTNMSSTFAPYSTMEPIENITPTESSKTTQSDDSMTLSTTISQTSSSSTFIESNQSTVSPIDFSETTQPNVANSETEQSSTNPPSEPESTTAIDAEITSTVSILPNLTNPTDRESSSTPTSNENITDTTLTESTTSVQISTQDYTESTLIWVSSTNDGASNLEGSSLATSSTIAPIVTVIAEVTEEPPLPVSSNAANEFTSTTATDTTVQTDSTANDGITSESFPIQTESTIIPIEIITNAPSSSSSFETSNIRESSTSIKTTNRMDIETEATAVSNYDPTIIQTEDGNSEDITTSPPNDVTETTTNVPDASTLSPKISTPSVSNTKPYEVKLPNGEHLESASLIANDSTMGSSTSGEYLTEKTTEKSESASLPAEITTIESELSSTQSVTQSVIDTSSTETSVSTNQIISSTALSTTISQTSSSSAFIEPNQNTVSPIDFSEITQPNVANSETEQSSTNPPSDSETTTAIDAETTSTASTFPNLISTEESSDGTKSEQPNISNVSDSTSKTDDIPSFDVSTTIQSEVQSTENDDVVIDSETTETSTTTSQTISDRSQSEPAINPYENVPEPNAIASESTPSESSTLETTQEAGISTAVPLELTTILSIVSNTVNYTNCELNSTSSTAAYGVTGCSNVSTFEPSSTERMESSSTNAPINNPNALDATEVSSFMSDTEPNLSYTPSSTDLVVASLLQSSTTSENVPITTENASDATMMESTATILTTFNQMDTETSTDSITSSSSFEYNVSESENTSSGTEASSIFGTQSTTMSNTESTSGLTTLFTPQNDDSSSTVAPLESSGSDIFSTTGLSEQSSSVTTHINQHVSDSQYTSTIPIDVTETTFIELSSANPLPTTESIIEIKTTVDDHDQSTNGVDQPISMTYDDETTTDDSGKSSSIDEITSTSQSPIADTSTSQSQREQTTVAPAKPITGDSIGSLPIETTTMNDAITTSQSQSQSTADLDENSSPSTSTVSSSSSSTSTEPNIMGNENFTISSTETIDTSEVPTTIQAIKTEPNINQSIHSDDVDAEIGNITGKAILHVHVKRNIKLNVTFTGADCCD